MRTRAGSASALSAVMAIVAAACSFGGGDSAPRPTATPSATAAPTATSAAAVAATSTAEVVFLDARPVEVVAGRSELPSDLALIVTRDGELRRIHRLASGELETRLLFDPFAYGSTRMLTYRGFDTTGPVLPNGQLAISACSTRECPGLSAASADALSTVFRSIDGGVSWSASAEIDGTVRVVSGAREGELLVQRLPREGDDRTGRLEWWPSGRVLDPPTEWASESEPAILPDNRVIWWTGGGQLLDCEGRRLLDLGEELSGGSVARAIAILPNADGSRIVVTWQENPPDSLKGPFRWSVYAAAGNRYELMDILAAPFNAIPTAWLGESELLFTADLDWKLLGEEALTPEQPRLPVILDVVEGTAMAIDVPGGTLGRGWAVAIQRGPFAEINAGVGDCLNLRTAPSLDGGVLRCVAHATLLEALSPIDSNWVLVRTSDAVEGWVSGEFLRQARPRATPTATPAASE